MKKTVLIAALGLGLGVVSSYGQGAIVFNSYLANASSGATKITFSSLLGGGLVGNGYTANVYYSLTPVSGPAGIGAIPDGLLASGSGAPSTTDQTSAMVAGYFHAANNFTLTSGGPTVYFDVVVYQTSAGSYANSAIRGQSGVFTGTLQSGINQPTFAQFGSFTVATAVPEPATLALAGLGGLASLVMLRRKKA
jgi:hypothetical protein